MEEELEPDGVLEEDGVALFTDEPELPDDPLLEESGFCDEIVPWVGPESRGEAFRTSGLRSSQTCFGAPEPAFELSAGRCVKTGEDLRCIVLGTGTAFVPLPAT